MPLALITGAARPDSIAAGITSQLRQDEWDVVTSDLSDVDYPCDLSTRNAPENLIGRVNEHHGPLSALILSHAHGVDSGILDTSTDSFDQHMAVNARASFLLIKKFAEQVPSEGGVVVALTSDHTTGNLPYGASKGALDRIVISAARELGAKGISANVVNPGPIDTGWMDLGFAEELKPMHPLDRLGTPTDIGAIVSFLVSPQGRWISGQLINADGGFSARY